MNKKKIIALAAAMCLMGALAAGSTFAYLQSSTDTAVNTFSSDRKISISLREPKWDGYLFGDGTVEIPDTEVPLSGTVPVSDEAYPKGERASGSDRQLGCNVAQSYLPGDIIAKNPIVLNTSAEEKVYTAVAVTFMDGAGAQINYEEFAKRYGSYELNEGWVSMGRTSDGELYLFGRSEQGTLIASELTPGQVTASVFDDIAVKPDIQEENGKLPAFKVNVTAYAVQAANVSPAEERENVYNAVTQLRQFITGANQ